MKKFNVLLDEGKIDEVKNFFKALEKTLRENDTNIVEVRILLALEEIGI